MFNYKIGLSIGVIFLFMVSVINPMTVGNNVTTSNKDTPVCYNFDRYLYPEYYNCYNVDEIPDFIEQPNSNKSTDYSCSDSVVSNQKVLAQPLDGPMDSPWPMYCHDTRHTGRSPYSTVDTSDILWSFKIFGNVECGPAIDNNGTIYVGKHYFYAIYPNGTLKWSYDVSGWIESCPGIDEDGIIYVGTVYGYFYAFYPNGTLKWIYSTEGDILSSPVIGSDGTIYFGNEVGYPLGGYINALYSNGTVKWRFPTDHVVYSSPVIGEDGTVYCGCHDTYLYALYPNNGTLKWKYQTGYWIRTAPCIADDGTIYVVSLDSYLHAVNPDGTQKWSTDVGAGTSPTIGQDGTIYCGYDTLFAVNPSDGSVKWSFNVGGTMRGGTPCNSVDGTIYVGTSDGGELIAINSNGTLKWRKSIGTCESAPAIGEDGNIYVGSFSSDCLYAFGRGELEANTNGPYYGLINQPVQFKGSASGGYSPYTSWHWDFGDTHTSDEQNPTHTYTSAVNHTVTLTVTDNTSNTSSDTTFAWVQVTNNPPNKPTIDGPTYGHFFVYYEYTFSATDPEGTPVWYYIDWDGPHGDTGWIGPSASGGEVVAGHWWGGGVYTIRCKAKDPYGEEGPWGTLKIRMPRSKMVTNSFFLKLLEKFPLLQKQFQRVVLL